MRDMRGGWMDTAREMNLGEQPLDRVLRERGLSNHDVVAASPAPLTHKAVQRARKGRRLTRRTQLRVAEAVNRALVAAGEGGATLAVSDLFNYGGKD
jgi:hypothetical protein